MHERTEDATTFRAPRWIMARGRALVALVATVLISACAATATTSGAGAVGAPPASYADAATTLPTRWVAVSVATLWVQPGIARPVDHPALTNPAHPGQWVAAMTVTQKKWLVGRLETQALYGTKVRVLATSGAWTKVAVTTQPTPRTAYGYPGWLPTVQLTASPPAAASTQAIVRLRTAMLWRDSASVGTPAGQLMRVSYGTRFPVAHVGTKYVTVTMLSGRHRVLRRSAVLLHATGAPWAPSGAAVVAEARRFLGLPYLWAGVSGFGYDCSGLTSSVYRQLGVTLPRDASRQAVHGTPVAKSALRPGDLVFVANAEGKVVHVAIYYGLHDGVRSVIHAPRTGETVHISPLASLTGYAGARRYVTP
jgi:gamma-D-glutamyl-L-lysine dipeptidyl-peptidase